MLLFFKMKNLKSHQQELIREAAMSDSWANHESFELNPFFISFIELNELHEGMESQLDHFYDIFNSFSIIF